MAITTVIERDASSGVLGIWNEDVNGAIINADGWIIIRLADAKGHGIKLRELCVDVDNGDGTTTKKTILALCSEPY